MKFQVQLPVLDHKGNTIPDTKADGTQEPLSLGNMLERIAIAAGVPNASGDEKFAQFKLAQKIGRAVELVELSAEEVVKLKTLAAPYLSPIAYGSIVEMLDSPYVERDLATALMGDLPAPAVKVDE